MQQPFLTTSTGGSEPWPEAAKVDNSIVETERFWTDGADARGFVPGAIPSHGCAARSVSQADGYAPAPLPIAEAQRGGDSPRLSDRIERERNRGLGQLAFASKDLAESRLRPHGPDTEVVCLECMCVGEGFNPAGHARNCRTGRVLRCLEGLLATVEPNGKEGATAGTASAGDGIRPRELAADALANLYRREALLIRLIAEARALAMAQIERASGGEVAFCAECVVDAPRGDDAGHLIPHEQACGTGRILATLAELEQTAEGCGAEGGAR